MDNANVKIDMLATLNLTRMRTCLDLLVQYGYVEKKKTLKETYESVIGVYKLNRTNPDMWNKLAKNEILSVFQFDTPQGIQSVSLAKPNSIEEMASLNSIMRLMASEKGAEQPLEKYARFKNNPSLWDKEMESYGLNQEQKELLHKYLDYEYGICASQEDIMSMIQDPQLGGWSLKDADMLRKAVARKDPKLYEKLTNQYYSTVKDKNLSSSLCNYFWRVLVNTQRGYSFNLSHVLSYSLVGLQNMNLACNYPIIFWNTANLIVDSAATDDEEMVEDIDQDNFVENIEELEKEEDEEESEEDTVTSKKSDLARAKKTVDYGKIAKAIGKFKSYGINFLPPDINSSKYTFSPIVESNSIVYGLRGVTRLSTSIIKEIIEKRPFTSIDDFLSKVKVNKPHMVNLIKCGAFDKIVNLPREEIMKNYLLSIADHKERLTLQNMQMLINYNLIPESMIFYKRLFLFNKFLKTQKNGIYYVLNDAAIEFIEKYFSINLIVNGEQILQKIWDNTYKKAMDPMRQYLKDNMSEILQQLNNKLYEEVKNKYAKGSISKWEMASLSFYAHDHELANFQPQFDNFFELPPKPEIDYTFTPRNSDKEVIIYKIHTIIGTVIDKNKNKNSVVLLTPTGVVNVKIYKNQYAIYDKRISKKEPDGIHKKVLEESWFSRGTLLRIQGIRRENDFIPKKIKNSIYPIIMKIVDINNDQLIYQEERMEAEE